MLLCIFANELAVGASKVDEVRTLVATPMLLTLFELVDPATLLCLVPIEDTPAVRDPEVILVLVPMDDTPIELPARDPTVLVAGKLAIFERVLDEVAVRKDGGKDGIGERAREEDGIEVAVPFLEEIALGTLSEEPEVLRVVSSLLLVLGALFDVRRGREELMADAGADSWGVFTLEGGGAFVAGMFGRILTLLEVPAPRFQTFFTRVFADDRNPNLEVFPFSVGAKK